MAFAPVGSITQVQAITDPETPGFDTSGANLLVVVIHDYEPAAQGTVSDNKSNLWTPLTAYIRSSFNRIRFYYATNSPTVGAGHTFKLTGTNYAVVSALAFSGAHVTAPFNKENGANASATTIQPGSVTPDQDDSLLITGVTFSTSPNSPSIDGGFSTPVYIDYNGGTAARGGAVSYVIQTSLSAANPTWTFDTSSESAAAIAVFKASAGVPGGLPFVTHLGAQRL